MVAHNIVHFKSGVLFSWSTLANKCVFNDLVCTVLAILHSQKSIDWFQQIVALYTLPDFENKT